MSNKTEKVYKATAKLVGLMLDSDEVVKAQLKEVDGEGKGRALVPISEFDRPDDLRVGQTFQLEVRTTYEEIVD